ncbi:MAG TPA: 23S rRNA (pseudouridine(1915)-N(3))-methyltransferase RlmH [Gemmatimonadales bacterium]|nr:23S rRNA (pseudouridine(1915)-N(3))-methyltransferase RlmH [Gemmatimonadales bacterium]
MKTTLLAVGKLRPAFRHAADEYLSRLRRYGPTDEIEVREAGKSPTAAESLREEAGRLAGKLPGGALVIALDREGEGWSSEALAVRLGRWRDEGRHLAFLVGGSHGLAPDLARAAQHRWSLGPITLPHELARVVVYEQLYRAWTIIRGEPYHK